MNGQSTIGAHKGGLYKPSYRVATVDRFHCIWGTFFLRTVAYPGGDLGVQTPPSASSLLIIHC